MGDVKDLVINLIATIIVFVSGLLTRELFHFTHARRGRGFWGKRMIGSRIMLFVGEFPDSTIWSRPGWSASAIFTQCTR